MNSIYKVYGWAAGLLLLGAAACSNDEEAAAIGDDKVKEVVFMAEDFEVEAASRTTFDITGETVKVTWKEGDQIGIIPENGAHLYFNIKEKVGMEKALFANAEGWDMQTGTKYVAYYPFIEKGDSYFLTGENMAFDYTGQTQNGNGNTDHLSKYDYMAAEAVTPTKDNTAAFKFKHLGCLLRIKIPLNNTAAVNSVTLQTSGNTSIPTSQTVNLWGTSTATKTDETATNSDGITLAVTGVSVTNVNVDATFYMMIPPVNLSSSNITIKVNYGDNNSDQTLSVSGKDFKAGYAYDLVPSSTNVGEGTGNSVDVTIEEKANPKEEGQS